MLKKIGIILFLLLFLLPIIKINAETTNAGFIPSNIWYSKDPFEEGDKIKIYTLIFNPDNKELSGTVNFYDKTTLLGKKTFAVAGKSVKDISIDWTVDVGEHKIFAKIENAKFLISSGKYENIILTENQTEESVRTISKKIVVKPSDSLDLVDNTQIKNIQNTIIENTPDFIAVPITSAINHLEGVRESVGEISKNKKEDARVEINTINTDTDSTKAKIGVNQLEKPVKYVKLFFYSFCSFIFNNKFIFYGILIVLVFFIVRFFWRMIF